MKNNIEPKTDKICKQFLDQLHQKSLPRSVAYVSAVYQAGLDYTPESIIRLESLLNQLNQKTNPDKLIYQQDKNKTFLVCVLGFYIGDYIAQQQQQETHWFTGKTYFTADSTFVESLDNKFICEINNILIQPLSFINKILFKETTRSLAEFMDEALALVTEPLVHSDNTSNDTMNFTAQLHAITTEQLNANAYSFSNLPIENNNYVEQAQTNSTDEHSNTESQSYDNQTSSSIKTKSQHNLSDASEKLKETYKADVSYEQKFNINYNSKVLDTFKLPKFPYVVASVPLALITVSLLYSVIKAFLTASEALPIYGMVFLGIFILALIAVWVIYAMSKVSVFDNKVTINTPFRSQVTRFDKRVRFFHVQEEGIFFGRNDHIVIKSNLESIKISSCEHDAITELLMEVEADILVPSLLDRLQNGETITFLLVKINDHSIEYGSVSTKIAEISDYDIEDNFLFIYKKNGDVFARIDINSEPNINSFLTILTELI